MSHLGVTPYMNVARIARTHGKNGEVVVTAIDGLPFCLRAGMRVWLTPPALRERREWVVAHVGEGDDSALVSFEGVRNLNDADRLVGRLVLVARHDAPDAELAADIMDCVGLEMVDEERGPLGTIVDLMLLPANDVWVVDGGPYGEILVPVIDDVVVSIPEHDDEPVVVRLLDGMIEE